MCKFISVLYIKSDPYHTKMKEKCRENNILYPYNTAVLQIRRGERDIILRVIFHVIPFKPML